MSLPRDRALQLALDSVRQKMLAIGARCWSAYSNLCETCGAPQSRGDPSRRALLRDERPVVKLMAAMNLRRLLILLRRTLLRDSQGAQAAAEELQQQLMASHHG